MPKLPRLTAREICSVLEKLGFSVARQSGSHYKNAEGKRATVPFHASKALHPKILKSIMRDAGLSAEDLEKLTPASGQLLGLSRRVKDGVFYFSCRGSSGVFTFNF